MNDKTFKAFVVSEKDDGSFIREIKERPLSSLPENEVLVRVHYSSLNYKDALSATGNKGVTRQYPHTPGVDAAGTVERSGDARFQAGDKVIVTSFDLGENTSGGFGHFIRVPGDWVVPLPEPLTLEESMMFGTAGFTAAYGLFKLQQIHASLGEGPVLVTGATGGVGSLAVALLANAGFEVVAATGKEGQSNFLRSIGANQVISRDEVFAEDSRPLQSARWKAAIDTVGGEMLDSVLRQTDHDGAVACCGNVLGGELKTSIYPFILRGVSLMGIDSGRCKMPMRKKIWQLLSTVWKIDTLSQINRSITLDQLDDEIQRILQGRQVGHVVLSLPVSD